MSAHLLIVDDEEEIREMLSRHFTIMDYEVCTAADGKEAIDIMNKKRVDIIITDLMMPGMNGIDLLEYIHTHIPTVHTISITGYVTLENALNCMRLGADTIVFKPLEDLTELEDAVKAVEGKMLNWQKKLRELRGMKPS